VECPLQHEIESPESFVLDALFEPASDASILCPYDLHVGLHWMLATFIQEEANSCFFTGLKLVRCGRAESQAERGYTAQQHAVPYIAPGELGELTPAVTTSSLSSPGFEKDLKF
jgi:hypothetical protein